MTRAIVVFVGSGQHVDRCIESWVLVFRILPNLSIDLLLPAAMAVLVKWKFL